MHILGARSRVRPGAMEMHACWSLSGVGQRRLGGDYVSQQKAAGEYAAVLFLLTGPDDYCRAAPLMAIVSSSDTVVLSDG